MHAVPSTAIAHEPRLAVDNTVLHLRATAQADNLPASPTIRTVIEFFDDAALALDVAIRVAVDEQKSAGGGTKGPRGQAQLLPVRRISLASPLEVEIEIAKAITESAAALGFLIYVVKRLWTVDLELRTRRVEQEDIYRRAVELAVRGAKQPESVWSAEDLRSVDVIVGREDHERPRPWEMSEAVLADWEELDWL
jgi:hypothetical protein